MEAALLVTALSLDAFIISFSLTASKVKIPHTSVFILAFIQSLVLFVSFYAGGKVLGGFISRELSKKLSFILLFSIGTFKFLSANDDASPPLSSEKELKAFDAVFLAIVLSVDNLTAGVGTGLNDAVLPLAVILSLAAGLGLIVLGIKLAKKMPRGLIVPPSALSGGVLAALGIIKLF